MNGPGVTQNCSWPLSDAIAGDNETVRGIKAIAAEIQALPIPDKLRLAADLFDLGRHGTARSIVIGAEHEMGELALAVRLAKEGDSDGG